MDEPYPRGSRCNDHSDVTFEAIRGSCDPGALPPDTEGLDYLMEHKDQMWPCEDGTLCLHDSLVCDGIEHCGDGSDENKTLCATCPRNFGYPGRERRQSATLSCMHRFTERPICATPCDGIDDLCKGLTDEDCSTSLEILAMLYGISLIFSIVAVFLLVVFVTWRLSRRSAVEDREEIFLQMPGLECLVQRLLRVAFKIQTPEPNTKMSSLCRRIVHRTVGGGKDDLAQFWLLLQVLETFNSDASVQASKELYQDLMRVHNGSTLLTLEWLREHLGTNSAVAAFIDRGENSLGTRALEKIKECTNVTNCLLHWFGMVWNCTMLFAKVSLYYFDYVKDIWLILLLSNQPVLTWSSFRAQLIVLSILSLVLTGLANTASVIANKTIKLGKLEKLLSSLLVVFIPAQLMIWNTYLKLKKKHLTYTFHTTQALSALKLKEVEDLESKRLSCQKLLVEFKRNENIFENALQLTILIILSALSITETKTVQDEQTSMGIEKVPALVVISAVASLRTLIFGTLAHIKMEKDGFLPIPGKLILILHIAVSVASRALAIVFYFTPTLGLFDALYHRKMGSMPMGAGAGSLIFDIARHNDTHFAITKMEDAWRPIDLESLTLFSLAEHYVALWILLCLCCLVNAASMLALVPKFRRGEEGSGATVKKCFHILSLLVCPVTYIDWDGSNRKMRRRATWTELGSKIAVFTLFNLLMTVPLMVLHARIGERDAFLRRFFIPLAEEAKSTRKARLLCAVAPAALGALAPLLQATLLSAYYRFGHPWSRLWGKSGDLEEEEAAAEEERLSCICALWREKDVAVAEAVTARRNWLRSIRRVLPAIGPILSRYK